MSQGITASSTLPVSPTSTVSPFKVSNECPDLTYIPSSNFISLNISSDNQQHNGKTFSISVHSLDDSSVSLTHTHELNRAGYFYINIEGLSPSRRYKWDSFSSLQNLQTLIFCTKSMNSSANSFIVVCRARGVG